MSSNGNLHEPAFSSIKNSLNADEYSKVLKNDDDEFAQSNGDFQVGSIRLESGLQKLPNKPAHTKTQTSFKMIRSSADTPKQKMRKQTQSYTIMVKSQQGIGAASTNQRNDTSGLLKPQSATSSAQNMLLLNS